MALNELLTKPDMHFVLFGGKGGVGKTSCAASSALWAAENTDKSVLIVSTDPAHSLGDSLGMKLEPGYVTPVNVKGKLYALEVSAKKAFEDNPVSVETPFGDLGSMNAPGADEAIAFGQVLEFVENSDYNLVVFDTAPTGHTLRLLELPGLLSGWIGNLLMLKLKMGSFFKGLLGKEKDDSYELFNKLKKAIDAAKGELQDPNKTSFVPVMIPEKMAILETEDLLSALYTYEIPVNYIIINQVLPDKLDCCTNDNCGSCSLLNYFQSRKGFQAKHLEEIRYVYTGDKDDFKLIEVPLFEKEVRELDSLRKMGNYLCNRNA